MYVRMYVCTYVVFLLLVAQCVQLRGLNINPKGRMNQMYSYCHIHTWFM